MNDLPRDVIALRDSVAAAYGKNVDITAVDIADPYAGGRSDVRADGTPEVFVNSRNPEPVTTLAHELHHLLLRAAGAPAVVIQTPYKPTREQGQALNQIAESIRDPIQHASFFPKLREIGLNPSANVDRWMKAALDAGQIDNLPDPIARTLTAFKALIELDAQSATLAALKSRYEKLGWSGNFQTAARMADAVTSSADFSPERQAKLFVDCAESAFGGQFSFTITGWDSVVRGRHRDRHVYVLMMQRR